MSLPSSYSLSKPTLDFLARRHGHFIGGRWLPSASGETFRIHDPASGAEIGEVAAGGAPDVDAAVKAARAAFEGPWSKFTSHRRGEVIWKLADLIAQNFQQLVELEVLDNGLPLPLAQYVCGMVVPEFFRYYAGWPTKIEGSTLPAAPGGKLPGEHLSFTLREPLGVVAAITPWNAPLPITMLKVAPALATGCTMILKPAELTPLTAMRLVELCQEAGVPDGVINLVNGYGATAGAALAAHPGVDKIAFTGSTAVGKQIVAGRRRQPEEGDARARRQVAGGRVRRCRPRAGDPGHRARLLLPAGPELHGRHAPVRAREDPRPGRRGRGRSREVVQARPGPRSPRSTSAR
jgi:phenylacetaldehyde dehydrogenase